MASVLDMSAMQEHKYSVILPTYNERRNLPLIVWMLAQTFAKADLDWEVIIVDDASPDGTQLVAKDLIRVLGEKHVQLRPRPGKLGLGSAYIHGLNYITGDYVVIMDADFSHHPKFILDFIKTQAATNADVVTGTRYALGGSVYGWDLRRKVISRGANLLAKLALWPGVSDVTGSFRLYKAHVLQDLISSVQSLGYVFQMEIIVRAKAQGYRVAEVPISFVDRVYGESKLGGSEILQYANGIRQLMFSV